ncbi:MAG: MetS family NSS transporter small subunit [Gemmatimonadota bacterium]|nr:MetS family NSS transporter small subunit [Gemmatimonadota bacterium]MDH3427308.1 MetS family NSS transporter small subunit [Gemmatimonadota bacterium]
MTTTGIVTMIAVLAFVWGGLALFVLKAVKKERAKSQRAA